MQLLEQDIDPSASSASLPSGAVALSVRTHGGAMVLVFVADPDAALVGRTIYCYQRNDAVQHKAGAQYLGEAWHDGIDDRVMFHIFIDPE